jgi:hypothetical protein
MKKLIALIAVAALGYVAFIMYTNATKAPAETPSNKISTTSNTAKPDLSNATFLIEDQSITLKKGANEQEVTPGSATMQETSLTKFVNYGDLNGDKKDDGAAVLVQEGGGSGTFFYIVGYVSGTVSHKGTNGVFVGDRISPQSVSIKNGVIILNYLDRKPDEAYDVEPSVSTTRNYVYKNGSLQEK